MKRLWMIVICMVMVTGCVMPATEDAADVDTPTAEEQLDKEADETTTGTEEKTAPTTEMPVLPDMDFEGLTFQEDGYEIVELRGLADGDTANFIVGGRNMAVRFLAIDTPETSGSSGPQPWALAAKAYTKDALENAKVIIIERDLESDLQDSYGRLLGWIWVDGELLNYRLVEEGLAYVKYLYGDYKYNGTMIELESQVQKTKIGIWGEKDPDDDYDDTVKISTIAEARAMETGSTVTIRGLITNAIGQNVFISDGTGGIYIYANNHNYDELGDVGTEIELTGKVIEYNGLTEISYIEDNEITIISEGNEVTPKPMTIDGISESVEGELVHLTNLTIEGVEVSNSGGYDIQVSSNGDHTTIRVDKYLKDYPDPDSLEVGTVIDVTGSVGQYHENYQIMIGNSSALTYK